MSSAWGVVYRKILKENGLNFKKMQFNYICNKEGCKSDMVSNKHL